jgi:hypothetical protein
MQSISSSWVCLLLAILACFTQLNERNLLAALLPTMAAGHGNDVEAQVQAEDDTVLEAESVPNAGCV